MTTTKPTSDAYSENNYSGDSPSTRVSVPPCGIQHLGRDDIKFYRLQRVEVENTVRIHFDRLEKGNSWNVPLALALTLLLALITSNFRSALGVSGDVWNALFIMGFIISVIWLAFTIYKRQSKSSIADFVNAICCDKSDD